MSLNIPHVSPNITEQESLQKKAFSVKIALGQMTTLHTVFTWELAIIMTENKAYWSRPLKRHISIVLEMSPLEKEKKKHLNTASETAKIVFLFQNRPYPRISFSTGLQKYPTTLKPSQK